VLLKWPGALGIESVDVARFLEVQLRYRYDEIHHDVLASWQVHVRVPTLL
jgi:hypothetical protein